MDMEYRLLYNPCYGVREVQRSLMAFAPRRLLFCYIPENKLMTSYDANLKKQTGCDSIFSWFINTHS